jgi:hypothetical protein
MKENLRVLHIHDGRLLPDESFRAHSLGRFRFTILAVHVQSMAYAASVCKSCVSLMSLTVQDVPVLLPWSFLVASHLAMSASLTRLPSRHISGSNVGPKAVAEWVGGRVLEDVDITCTAKVCLMSPLLSPSLSSRNGGLVSIQ